MPALTILAILPFYGSNAPRFLVDAMERAVCRIIRVGPKYKRHLGLDWADEELPLVDYELPKESNWHVDGLLDLVTPRFGAPDLVFLSEEGYDNIIINTEKIPSIFYSCDGWASNYKRAEMVKATVNFTNHPRGIRQQPQETLPDGWQWLSGAALPSVHKYLGLERTIDFALLATMYTKRPEICAHIQSQGFSIKIGQTKTQEYVHAYNKALATLHNPGWYEIKWRAFESAAMGCLNLSPVIPPLDWLGYAPWIHYVPVKTVETDDGPWPDKGEVAKLLLDIKKHPVFFRGIANKAREHTIAHHSYYNRAQQIFKSLGMGEWEEKTQEKIDGAWQEHLST